MFMRQPKPQTIATSATLLARLKNWDDQTGWQEFDRTYRRLIVAFAIKQGLSEPEAQDVAQETLLAVARDIARFQYDPARSSFKNWLLKVTRHRIVDHCRRRPREVKARAPGACETARTSTVGRVRDPNTPALDAIWDDEWKRTMTEHALERLKDEVSTLHFQIFYLGVIKEQPAAKVAAALGAKLPTVYVVRHRLGRRFKKIMVSLQQELA
jgi:RNA polymerase sigma-70 factor (ECF subfamily)